MKTKIARDDPCLEEGQRGGRKMYVNNDRTKTEAHPTRPTVLPTKHTTNRNDIMLRSLLKTAFAAASLAVVTASASLTCPCADPICPDVGVRTIAVGSGSTLASYLYVSHNSTAVVSSASVSIGISDIDHGTDSNSCTEHYSRLLDDDDPAVYGDADCDAGHILANRLGGPGNLPTNMFPQDLHVNRGIYATYEETIYNCIADNPNEIASLYWTFDYENDSRLKPDSVTYTAHFLKGSCPDSTMTFTNCYQCTSGCVVC